MDRNRQLNHIRAKALAGIDTLREVVAMVDDLLPRRQAPKEFELLDAKGEKRRVDANGRER
jgi:hypothetical protein